eukprot:scaffold37007_cov15-Tisochrysis_lutea.AAC.1
MAVECSCKFGALSLGRSPQRGLTSEQIFNSMRWTILSLGFMCLRELGGFLTSRGITITPSWRLCCTPGVFSDGYSQL